MRFSWLLFFTAVFPTDQHPHPSIHEGNIERNILLSNFLVGNYISEEKSTFGTFVFIIHIKKIITTTILYYI